MAFKAAPDDAGGKPQLFDAVTYDEKRLKLDEMARQRMAGQAVTEAAEEAAVPGSKEGAWKWEIRKRMWDSMEANDIARFPRPVHHRIPNFAGAEEAAARLEDLPEFRSARVVKVNPDTPQKMVRHAVLSSGKVLLAPQPRLRTGFFSKLSAADIPASALMEACTSAGVAKYGQPIGLDEAIKVDLIVVGSSAVCPSNGARLGKGEGFAELEYGMLRWMGAVDAATLVVTTIHDCQLLKPGEIEDGQMLEHDVPVDIVVTPTQVIRLSQNRALTKPPGILWHRLSPEKLGQVLRELKERIEQETGVKLPTGPSEVLPKVASRGARRGRRPPAGGRGKGRRLDSDGGRQRRTD